MIRCNQCGEMVFTNRAKKCPKCGESLEDEMQSKIRSTVRVTPKKMTKVLIVAVVVLAGCLTAEYSSRLYSWDEYKTEEIVDKYTHTYTVTERHSMGDDPPHYYYDSHTYTDYYFYLNQSGKKGVNENTYHAHKIGSNYTYTVTHIDWKPGMKDAPIPLWVWIIPLTALIAISVPVLYFVHARRVKEMNEWKETGDLLIDREE